MRIAINTRFLLSRKMEGFGWFTYEISKRLVEQHPEHTFILFFDRKYDPKFIFGDNVIPVILNPPARHPFLFVIWFEIAVRRALKKYHPDVFLSPDGYLSLKADVPQIPVIHDLNFEHHLKDIPWLERNYFRYFFPKFAQKAAKIVTVSHYSKADIVQQYGISPQKINVAWNGASELFQPISELEKASVRAQFSVGKPYFIFVGALHPRKNVGRLLQAFEVFIQNGGTEDMVIVGENLFTKNAGYLKGISADTLKRIHFTGHLPLTSLVRVLAGACCLTYVPYFEGFGIPIVEAMRCGVPVISGNLTSLPEVAGDAALYVDPFNVSEITAAMQQISNDENLRNELSVKGLERAKLFNWDFTADKIWETIKEVVKAD